MESLYKRHINLFIVIFLFLISFAVRINSLSNSFVLDDYRLIIDNSFIHDIGNFFKIADPRNLVNVLPVVCGARPLTVVSLMADYFVFGQNPAGYHLINILLHCFNSILLFLFVLRLTKNKFIGVVSSLFFSIHPIQSEIINVVSFRADLLCSFFTLIFLNLTALFKNAVKNKKKLIMLLMFVSFAFALFSKESAIMIPFFTVAYIFFFHKEKKINYLFLGTVAGAVLFFLFFWIKRFPVPLYNIIYPSLENNFTPLNNLVIYINIIFASVYYNFMHIIYPVNLSVDYFITYSWSKFLFALFVAGLAAIGFFKIKSRYFKFSLMFTITAYLPVCNIIPLVNTIADRYMAMPMIGISMIFAYAVLKSFKIINSKATYIFLILLFIIYSAVSYQRGFVYANQYSLYSDAVSKNPQNIRTSYNMAVAYLANNEFDNAIKQFDNVIKINPVYRRDQVWFLTGIAYESLQNIESARKYYHKAFLLNNKDKNIITKFRGSFETIDQAKQYIFSNTFKLDKQAFFNFEENTKRN